MPILPGEIRRQMPRRFGEEPLPYKVGEEGAVYKVEQADKHYIAKQWYAGGDRKWFGEAHDNQTSLSPFWGKVKFWEYRLIHRAFPDMTLEVVATFDERITKNHETGEMDFEFRTGRPVTVSKEVEGDPELVSQRDDIMDPLYEKMLGYRSQTRAGHYATPEQRAEFYRVIAEADSDLERVLGYDNLTLPLSRAHQGGRINIDPDTIGEAIQQGLIGDTDSPLVDLLKYGVLAIHPQLNYVPTGRDADGKVHGTYIELAIASLDQYVGQTRNDKGDAGVERIMESAQRYQMYKILNDLYDESVMIMLQSDVPELYSSHVRNELFHVLEALRAKVDEYSIAILPAVYQPLLDALRSVLGAGYDERKTISDLQAIKGNVEQLRFVAQ